MRFYVGSSFSNIEEVRFIRDHLVAFGHTHTYDWTQNERAASIDALRAIGEEEVAGIQTADFVVILLPGGKGAHVELRIALRTNKPVFLCSNKNTNGLPPRVLPKRNGLRAGGA